MAAERTGRDWPTYPSVLVSWDNTPRRGRDAIVMINATPEAFEHALAEAVTASQSKPFDERLVFINAWNEWGEGNYLEPDAEHGLEYLRATAKVLLDAPPV